MTLSEVEDQLADMIQAVILKKVSPDTLLLESGLLDSVAAVDLMLAIESRFGCTVPLTEVEEHLYSLRTLSTYVAANC
ncbi:acyl carrier protein [Simplicispira suum]|jgi:D-alanine--poly(phosphoribitol) ligase subunit 2|uniref:Acyl carrier protein n=1 Tax=Simplicispira suum TaxID=2109915 RepID=A0A2S0N1M5_9BURK|nr:phosphopantetheine-binding protein [Simplicispira suum]AVO41823.1 acyl carrier protein [Simplicispira suum]MCB1979327.1 acyl carrier protein [Burkholderiaceae bacterium]MCO5102481.1 acyl carrier protein [Burkholderiaceae bacterium]